MMTGFSYMPEIMTYKPAYKLNHRVPWPLVIHDLCAATPGDTSSLCNADRRVTVTFSPAAVGEEACENQVWPDSQKATGSFMQAKKSMRSHWEQFSYSTLVCWFDCARFSTQQDHLYKKKKKKKRVLDKRRITQAKKTKCSQLLPTTRRR